MLRRSVLPARRNWLTLRTFLLCGLISGCAAHIAATSYEPPTVHEIKGVQPHYWTTIDLSDNGYRCEPPWLLPATYCGLHREYTYNGCSWSCGPRDVSEDKQ